MDDEDVPSSIVSFVNQRLNMDQWMVFDGWSRCLTIWCHEYDHNHYVHLDEDPVANQSMGIVIQRWVRDGRDAQHWSMPFPISI